MLTIADFLFEHTGSPLGPRDWCNKYRITTPSTPLVILPQHEHRALIHAIAILHARGLFPLVTIDAGDNPRLLNKVHTLASALGVRGQIRFLTDTTPAATAALLSSSQINQCQILVVTPPDREMSAVLTESMANGCTVVGSTASSITQAMIENGVDGHLVPPLNPQALATVLEKLLRDTRYTQSLGQAAKAKATHLPALSH